MRLASERGGNTDITEADLQKAVEIEEKRQQERERYSNIRQIAGGLSLLVVALPVYIYHWRKIQASEA